jgi:very-short-patch-repair endonuclease
VRGDRGDRFRRQHPIGPYILDFFASRLAVEVDGAAHNFAARARHDQRREAWLAAQGISLLRFTAMVVQNDRNLEDVLTMIVEIVTGSSSAVRGTNSWRSRESKELHEWKTGPTERR